MNATLRARLLDRLAKIRVRIENAETAIDEAALSGASSFELDTGEAMQKMSFQSIGALRSYLDSLYAAEEQIMRRLGGTAVISCKVRRKP